MGTRATEKVIHVSEGPVLRKCAKCGHWECPCCTDWCDACVKDEDPCEATMECVYDALAPFSYDDAAEDAKIKGWDGNCDRTLEDGRVSFLNEVDE